MPFEEYAVKVGVSQKVVCKVREDQEFFDSPELKELRQRIIDKNLTLQDHLNYLRLPSVQKNFKAMIIILNSFHKKLVNNEGVALDDDLNRETNMKVNLRIRKILKETKEVRATINTLE